MNRSNNEMYLSGGATRAVAIACLLGAVGCSDEIPTPVANEDLQTMEADQVLYGMTSFLSSSGVREGRVEADTAFMFADSSVAQLRQMEIVFYDEEGRETATVTGTRGRWSPDSDVMVARGDVVLIVHHDDSLIESQEIHYDPARELVWSDSLTTRTLADGTVTRGTSFESDMTFENFEIRNPRGGAAPGS